MTPLLSTVILDPFTALIFGSALGLVSGALIRKQPEAELKTTVILGAAWGGWWGLSVGWFFFFRPDWMFAYSLDTQKLPLVPLYVFFLLVLMAFGVFGAVTTGVLMQYRKTGLAVALALGSVVTNLSLTALQSNAYLHVGTYAQYVSNQAPGLETDAAMKLAMNVSGAGAAIVALAILFWRFKKARAA